jgi:hypothetical protein
LGEKLTATDAQARSDVNVQDFSFTRAGDAPGPIAVSSFQTGGGSGEDSLAGAGDALAGTDGNAGVFVAAGDVNADGKPDLAAGHGIKHVGRADDGEGKKDPGRADPRGSHAASAPEQATNTPVDVVSWSFGQTAPAQDANQGAIDGAPGEEQAGTTGRSKIPNRADPGDFKVAENESPRPQNRVGTAAPDEDPGVSLNFSKIKTDYKE